MRVALISAPEMAEVAFVNKWVAELLYNMETILPPIGLLYLATYLEKEKHIVKVFNITVFKYPIRKLLKDLSDFKPDLVGLSLSSNSFPKSLHIINRIKETLRVPIVVGGPHVAIFHERALLSKNIDFGVYGEGEEVIVELANNLENGGDLSSIKGLIYKKGCNIVKNPERPLVKNLDEISFPAYHLIDFDKYTSARFGKSRFGVMFNSRGCPFKCSFCFNPSKYRLRSVDNVIEEIRYLHKTYGIRKIHFWDSTFTVSKQWIKEFAEKIQQLPFNLKYTCYTRVDKVDSDVIRWLKESGCINVCYGIESVDPDCLNAMNKNTNPGMIEQAIELARSQGLRVHCMFIFGTPGETQESLNRSISFILNNFIGFIQIRPLQLMPGTKFYEDHLQRGGKDFWNEIVHGRPTDVTQLPEGSNFTKKQLDNIVRKTVLKYFFKPTNMVKLYKNPLGEFSFLVYIKGFIAIASMFLQLIR